MFASPCGAAGLVRWTVRGLNMAQAADNAINAGAAFQDGNIPAGLTYLASAALSAYSAARQCFAAGTPLLTPTGDKPIEQFRPGDWILSAPEDDPEAPPEAKKVEEIFTNFSGLLELHVGGRVIRTTGEHAFFVRGRGWTAAHDLMPGDRLRSHDGKLVVLDKVVALEEEMPVYNLRVAEYHTYFVASREWGFSVWAHNTYRSRIHDDRGLIRQAEAAGRTHQASIDRLTAQLARGNLNPGIGTRGVFGNVLEGRSRDGARVFFRTLPGGGVEVLAKATKVNQAAVISVLRRIYGG